MILAIDQGTTGTTCLVVDDELRPRGRGYREIAQHFPAPGWVEHDPEEIWASVLADRGGGARRCRDRRGRPGCDRDHEPARDDGRLGARDRAAGAPRDRLAGPPHRRPLRRAARGARAGAHRPRPRPLLLRHEARVDPRPHRRCRSRELAFGTVDAWLVWKLTGGTRHVTDLTNASRTMLLDIHTGSWDDELLELFGVDRGDPARGRPVVGRRRRGRAARRDRSAHGDRRRPAGGAFRPGLLRAGRVEGDVRHGHVRARQPRARAGAGRPGAAADGAAATAPGLPRQFAAEGAILVGGAAVQWLRDGLGIIADAAETRARSHARSTRLAASPSCRR